MQKWLVSFLSCDHSQIPPSVTGRLIGPGGRQINEIQECRDLQVFGAYAGAC